MCEVLDIPRSTYYQSLTKTESAREHENRLLLEHIQLIHKESKGRYGVSKIHFLLLIAGFSVSPETSSTAYVKGKYLLDHNQEIPSCIEWRTC
jgi:hypothetical protein